jgi:hypothetical protein
MAFNVKQQRQATRTILLKWESDQGEHDCQIVYRLGVLGAIPDSDLKVFNLDQWIEQVVARWDVEKGDSTPIPPTQHGILDAETAGEGLPFWFKNMVMDAIYSDARPPTLTSRPSDDSL